MARNEEKAQSLLNRWTSMKSEMSKGGALMEYVCFAYSCIHSC